MSDAETERELQGSREGQAAAILAQDATLKRAEAAERALDGVHGALADAASVTVPEDDALLGDAVRALAKERDAARAVISAREDGYTAAGRAEPERSPHDEETPEGAAWLEGYCERKMEDELCAKGDRMRKVEAALEIARERVRALEEALEKIEAWAVDCNAKEFKRTGMLDDRFLGIIDTARTALRNEGGGESK